MDLDYLIAAKTPPYHSWWNPVERVMSVLNLGLQCIGMMRTSGNEVFEKEMSQCGSMKTIRKAAEMRKEFKDDLLDSVEPVKFLLNQTFQRLQLKEKNITCLSSAADQEILEIWEALKTIDNNVMIQIPSKLNLQFLKNLFLKSFLSLLSRETLLF